jgi:hypothetical protein
MKGGFMKRTYSVLLLVWMVGAVSFGQSQEFVVGTFGLIAHFNGSTWKVYTGVTGATLSRISVKGNTVAAVGTDNGIPIILVGKRQ